MALIYLDSCALIEAIEKRSPKGQALVDLISDATGCGTSFITSELSLVEVLVDPIRGIIDRRPEDEDAVRRRHHDWYFYNLVPDGALIQTIAVDRDILKQAATMRARVSSLRTPDAIHAATAYRSACTHFVTGDTRLVGGFEGDRAWLLASNRFAFVDLDVAALTRLTASLVS